MAKICLDYIEAEEGELPPVCMRCGVEIDVDEQCPVKEFVWMPMWAIVTGYVIFPWVLHLVLTWIFAKTMTVVTPLCWEHRSHWKRQQWLFAGGLIAVGIFFFGSIFVATGLEENGERDHMKIALLATLGVGVLWVMTMLVMYFISIRPIRITEDSITLRGVSEQFVAAVHAFREEQDLDEEWE